MKSFSLLLSLLPLVSGGVVPRDGRCPYNQINSDRLIPNRYRVLFHDGHTLEEHFSFIGLDLSNSADSFTWVSSMNGYHANLTHETLHDLVRLDPGVEIVEHSTFSPPPDGLIDRGETITRDHPQNLDKRWSLSEGMRPWYLRMTNSGTKEELVAGADVKDAWYTEAGEGVKIYILDSGIRLSHQIFDGRASNFKDLDYDPFIGDIWDDISGHGTHVAGIAAFQAPAAKIINAKCLAAEHTAEMTIAALDAIVQEHQDNISGDPNYHGAVINMSFGEDDTEGLRRSIAAALDAGIPVVTSAGNSNEAAPTVPCGYDRVICTAACTFDYARWKGSNYGPLVTIFAPGADMLSASYQADDQWFTLSGTSMASPMVAGILAGYIGYERLQNDLQTVLDRLGANMIYNTLSGLTTRIDPTVNYLAQTGFNSIGKIPSLPYFISLSVGALKMAAVDEDAAADVTDEGPTATFTQSTTLSKVIVSATGDVTRGIEFTSAATLPLDQATPLSLSIRTTDTSSTTSTSSSTTTSETPAPTESLECGIPTQPEVFFNKFAIGPGQDAIDKICGWPDAGVDMHLTGHEYQGISMMYGADGRYAMTTNNPDGNDLCSPWPGTCDQTGAGSGFILGFYADYDDDGLPGVDCPAHQSFDFPSGDECRSIFMSIMNNCNTDTTTQKEGGYFRKRMDYGCMRFTMGAKPW